MPCWQVEWADVLVYDMWASGSGEDELTRGLHMEYPGKAIVLTSQGMDVGWEDESTGAIVTGSHDPKALVTAVESAYDNLTQA